MRLFDYGGLSLLVSLVACGSSSPSGFAGDDSGTGNDSAGGDGGVDTIASISNDLAHADCARKFECMPYAALTRAYGDDEPDCARQTAGYLTRSLSAPGSSSDFSGMRACVAQLKAGSCADYRDYSAGQDPTKLPACSAFTPGALPEGAGCAYGRQCASNDCKSAEGQCGKCVALAAYVGAQCDATTQPCDPTKSLLCNFATRTCFTPKRRGEMCNVDSDCFANQLCLVGMCADYPSAVGASCDPNTNNCSFRVGAGLVCNNQSISCQLPDTTGAVGAACGLGGATGGLVVCAKGGMCDGSRDGYSGQCIAGHAAPAGGSCAFTGLPPNGPSCEAEGQCTGGTCRIADPTTCM
jgi:hypothetical protein